MRLREVQLPKRSVAKKNVAVNNRRNIGRKLVDTFDMYTLKCPTPNSSCDLSPRRGKYCARVGIYYV